MAPRAPESKASLLDSKIDILNRSAAETSPAPVKQIFRAVVLSEPWFGLVLSLFDHLRTGIISLATQQDEIIDDSYSVELSEYCFDVCEVLKTVTQGNNIDNLNESMTTALGDLERCVH